MTKQPITVSALVNAPIEKVWTLFTTPEHIMHWNQASDDWHTPAATNDLRHDGRFSFTMAAKDGSFQFDFGGTYTIITPLRLIEYVLDDQRQVRTEFAREGDNATRVTQIFDPEAIHSPEMQQQGWQAILDSFKRYAEASTGR
jgi:uncharacterized protein YndB with AHSA1/START domain